MRILIAIPCLEQTSSIFDQCLDNLDRVGQTKIARLPGSLVYAARNDLAEEAIRQEADYVMWIDSDMVFNHDLLSRLIESIEGKDIVAPLFFRRKKPFNPPIYKSIKLNYGGEHEVEEYDDYPEDSMFEVDAVGFGCVLMRTKVLKDVIEHNHTCFNPMPAFGEDISFCIRAKRAGYKIWVDSSIKIGHLSQTIVTEEFYKNYRSQNNGRNDNNSSES